MTLQLANQGAVKALNSVLGAIAQWNASGRAHHKDWIEARWLEMTAAGDLLIDAMRREQEFRKADITKGGDELLEQWRIRRSTVDRLAQDYASAVDRWLEAIHGDLNR